MSTLKKSRNNEPLSIRAGDPIGGIIATPDTDLAADTYYRLMPSGNAATVINPTELRLHAFENGQYGDVGSGNSFKASPSEGDVHVFLAAVGSGLAWVDTDGTTDLTAAEEHDSARYDGAEWVKQHYLRHDIRNAAIGQGWNIRIYNKGYEQVRAIEYVDNFGSCVLRMPLDYVDALPTFLEFCIYPNMLMPLSIKNEEASAEGFRLAFSRAHEYEPNSDNLRDINFIEEGDVVEFTSDAVDRLWYYYPTVGSAGTSYVNWSENKLQ